MVTAENLKEPAVTTRCQVADVFSDRFAYRGDSRKLPTERRGLDFANRGTTHRKFDAPRIVAAAFKGE